MKDDPLTDLDIAGYGEFYSMMFGGFEDCESDEEIMESSEEEMEEAEDIGEESDDDIIDYPYTKMILILNMMTVNTKFDTLLKKRVSYYIKWQAIMIR